MKTTLNLIRAHSPCRAGWARLLANLGKTKADDEELLITTILESNGVDDALWCLRAVEGHERKIRLFAVECARSVQYLMTDTRSINAINVSERFANGLATPEELRAAEVAAEYAARDAGCFAKCTAAEYAAWDIACIAAGTAAHTTAWDIAEEYDAWTAGCFAACIVGGNAARDAQANLLILVCEGCFDE